MDVFAQNAVKLDTIKHHTPEVHNTGSIHCIAEYIGTSIIAGSGANVLMLQTSMAVSCYEAFIRSMYSSA